MKRDVGERETEPGIKNGLRLVFLCRCRYNGLDVVKDSKGA